MKKLPGDCLHEIFKYLEGDKITLYSCLLVNRLWCKVSVRFLWREVQNYETLITCFPNESKEILYKNRILISIDAIIKPPLFNYAGFCKVLSINQIKCQIDYLLEDKKFIYSKNPCKENTCILAREIYKLFTKPSLK